MRAIWKRCVACLLAFIVFAISILGHWQPVSAVGLALPVTEAGIAAGETLQFLYSLFMSLGFTISIKELLSNSIKKADDNWLPDNWDWGDLLDDPATQGQIDATEEKVEEYYDNAVRDWYENHGGKITPSPEPTKTPETSPPAEVTPVPTSIPEIDEKIDTWNEMKKKALSAKELVVEAAAGICIKEAAVKFWNEIMDNTPPSTNLKGNPFKGDIKDYVGHCNINYECDSPNKGVHSRQIYFYNTYGLTDLGFYGDYSASKGLEFMNLYSSVYDATKNVVLGPSNTNKKMYLSLYQISTGPTYKYDGNESTSFVFNSYTNLFNVGGIKSVSYDYEFYIPYNIGGEQHEADTKPLMKPALWVSPNLKKMLDDASKSPELPDPSPIKLPSLDEIKDFNKKADDSNEEDRPSIVQNFINDHIAPDPTPEPTPSTTPAVVPDPDPDPQPTGSPDPDPNPTSAPDTTPSVTPALPVDPDISPGPNPSGSPDPDPQPTGSPSSPDTPDTDDTDPDHYKTDLRLVFPFCIPFDLIHLLKVFEAEPEAPVFKFPLDLELKDPFTDKKVLDYHHEFVFDFSDYEEVIKLFRLCEVIAFLMGLMMITRQQMIKG